MGEGTRIAVSPRVHRKRSPMLILSLIALALVGCTTPDLVGTLRECALLTEGEVNQLPFYAPTECYESCLAEASCEELGAALCGASIALLQECDERCAFRCEDGALIAVAQICDDVPNCADESDERGCAVYTCTDGTTLNGEHRCDGITRCPDRSDEEDCPLNCDDAYPPSACPYEQCADGSMLRAGGRCNGWPQCEDGSDEVGCAQVVLMCG